jgi:hypothetical protein
MSNRALRPLRFGAVPEVPESSPPKPLPPGGYYVLGGEEPDEKRAAFRLMGDRLDPDTVTETLGLTPAAAHRKGDPNGRFAPYKSGQWTLRSADAGETSKNSMEGHLMKLLDQLEPRAAILRRLSQAQGLEADFYCGYFMHQSNSGFRLAAATLERIAALDASLGFDIYGPPLDDEDRTEIVE